MFITIKTSRLSVFYYKRQSSRRRSDLQSAVYLQVELFELLVGERGAVGAEELLHLKTSQTAVTPSLSETRRRLKNERTRTHNHNPLKWNNDKCGPISSISFTSTTGPFISREVHIFS